MSSSYDVLIISTALSVLIVSISFSVKLLRGSSSQKKNVQRDRPTARHPDEDEGEGLLRRLHEHQNFRYGSDMRRRTGYDAHTGMWQTTSVTSRREPVLAGEEISDRKKAQK